MFHCKIGQVLKVKPKKVCKSEKGKYCVLMHGYGIQKDVTDEANCRTAMEMKTQRTVMDMGQGGRRGYDEWREQHGNIYTIICKIDSQWDYAV